MTQTFGWVALVGTLASVGAADANPRGTADITRDTQAAMNAIVNAIDKHDAHALAKLLHAPLELDGFWFQSADCTSTFGATRVIAANEIESFAACLAAVTLVHGLRTPQAFSVTGLLAYEPGLEIAFRFRAQKTNVTLMSLGSMNYTVSGTAAGGAPTVLPSVLEARRVAGSANPALTDTARAKYAHTIDLSATAVAITWFKVCVDDKGMVASAQGPVASSDEWETFTHSVEQGIRAWRFQPIALDGHATPVCSMMRFVYPPARTPQIELVPVSPMPPAAPGPVLERIH